MCRDPVKRRWLLFKRFAFIIFEGVGAASPNVTSNYKESETGVVHPFGQLVDSARIDSDSKCNEYVAYDTGQIEQRYLAWINLVGRSLLCFALLSHLEALISRSGIRAQWLHFGFTRCAK
ncbi:hypothetical protein EGR_10047 [Echinococcus granulosus]|uniref:Uncharacterized protein n=1 Tax=Echinococcus granulosus TaxID=6210 RepID=W6U1U9_ECHGR|nr:hypothetical protein EGR_10047 [Echinococcus granulosus]EUB55080.1 hypothetical protein EGR_10047 [Echinococcus granulosus]